MMKISTIAKLDKSMGQVQFGNPAKFHFQIIGQYVTFVLRETLINNQNIA